MLARAMTAAIRFYRNAISPLKPPVCRFYPTCSAYGLEAIEKYGAGRGSWLLVRRLYGRPLDTLLVTFGVSLILQQFAKGRFGAENVLRDVERVVIAVGAGEDDDSEFHFTIAALGTL